MSKNNDKKICEQIIEYYLLHKEFECIFKYGFNPFFKDIKNNILNKAINPFNEIYETNLYIIDINWIDYWKIYSNYEKAKSYFDEINIFDKNINIKKELEEMCKNMIITKEINTEGLTPPPQMDNTLVGNTFSNKLFYKLEDFNCLVSQNNFLSYSSLSGEYFESRTNTRKIEAFIIDKIIFLIFDIEFKIKIIYKKENGIIQLTVDFITNEANVKENKKSFENKLFNFKREKIRRERTDYWFYFFDSYNIEKIPKVEIRDKKGQIEYILRNDKLFQNKKSTENFKIYKNGDNIDNIIQTNYIKNGNSIHNSANINYIDKINMNGKSNLKENNENTKLIESNTILNFIKDANLNKYKSINKFANNFNDNVYYNDNNNIFINNMGNMNKKNFKNNHHKRFNSINACNNKVRFFKKNDLKIFSSNAIDLPTMEIINNAMNKNNVK